MKKPLDAKDLAIDILERSRCAVQVGAAIQDAAGRIVSWGWNSEGFDGMGLHAERHAILRANKKRLTGATIVVASKRRRNNKSVISKPCAECQRLIDKWELKVEWRSAEGMWEL